MAPNPVRKERFCIPDANLFWHPHAAKRSPILGWFLRVEKEDPSTFTRHERAWCGYTEIPMSWIKMQTSVTGK